MIESGNVLLAAVIAYQVGMLTFGPLDRLLDTRNGSPSAARRRSP